MDLSLLTENLLSAPILFFLLGIVAALLRSDLDVPESVARFLALYLLMAIGFHGGVELRANGIEGRMLLVLLVAMAGSFLVPFWCYAYLRSRFDHATAAAVAACYGSISAVTFVTAVDFLETRSIDYSGYMVAAMALMESPAIIAGMLLYRMNPARATGGTGDGKPPRKKLRWGPILHEATFNGAVVLLIGGLLIGLLTGQEGWADLKPFVKAPFKGALCLFLLDMGLVAARRLGDLKRTSATSVTFGIGAAVCHAALGMAAAWVLGMGEGDALLFAVLWGSASYIAVPAAMRLALPEANAGVYIPLALAITFPFNIIVGIPLYFAVIRALW